MKKFQNTVLLSLICMILISVYTLLEYGHQYLMKNFFESEFFQSEYQNFTDQLGPLVLNPLDADEAKSNIKVSDKEIEEYRNYNGTLSEQITNINEQYQDKIDEAKDSKVTSVKNALIKDRDKKIQDITKNFEDDDYVRDKIIKIKEKKIDRYVSDLENRKQDFLKQYDYFTYKLKEVSTGDTFSVGNLNNTAIYIQKYDGQKKILKTETISTEDSIDDENWNAAESDSPDIPYDITNTAQRNFHQYLGEIHVDKNAFLNSSSYQEYKNFKFRQIVLGIIWVLGLLSIIVLFWIKPFHVEKNDNHFLLRTIRRWPIDVRALCLFITGNVIIIEISGLLSRFINIPLFGGSLSNLIGFVLGTIIFYLLVWFVVMQLLLIIEDMNTEEKRLKAYRSSFTLHVIDDLKNLFLSMSIGLQAIALLIIVFLSGVGIVGAMTAFDLMPLYLILFFTIALPAMIVFLRRVSYLNKIMKQTEEMVEGRLNSEIKVRGKSAFGKHASHLNRLREGVRTSITEQAKSERLKTELITNVSHDLRTPLTSIITYTDLLKNPDLTEDERNSYIAILDKKSQRLKTLIEDLFEVSKMASGNLELQKEKVNLNQLLQQALGELEEDMEKADMTFRVHITDEPLMAYVDGQKWWRVLDNLIINALKYTMEGTRVYISLDRVEQNAQFVIKNITKYELGNQNVEELYERFKRADTSRHTEGSGLGLAITQSIVDLHHGSMEITVDGDLFKVVVNVPLVS